MWRRVLTLEQADHCSRGSNPPPRQFLPWYIEYLNDSHSNIIISKVQTISTAVIMIRRNMKNSMCAAI